MIASGGMGAVYEAVHEVTGRQCALKVMLGHTLERDSLRDRFMREARVAAKIQSRHIVDVLDAGVDDFTNAPFLVMELLEGEDVSQRLARLGRLERSEAVLLLWQTALALDKLHRRSIVHRDLKPRNLFVAKGDDGKPAVKLLDFGVAKMLSAKGTEESGTQNVGTPLYMAPEQFSASGRISGATDIYALGLLAFTLLVGEHYWRDEHARSDNPFAFAALVSSGPVERASVRSERHGMRLPQAFDEWFRKATAESPNDRFDTAVRAVTALALALGVSVPSPPPEDDSSTPASGPRNSDFPSQALPETEAGSSVADDDRSADVGVAAAAAPHARRSHPDRLEATNTSLSVTNGSGEPSRRVDERSSPTRRRWLLVAVGAAAAAGLAVAVVALREEDDRAAHEEEPSAPSAVAAASASEAPAERATDAGQAAAPAPDPDEATQPLRPAQAENAPPPKAAAPAAKPAPKNPKPRPNRTHLYTRE